MKRLSFLLALLMLFLCGCTPSNSAIQTTPTTSNNAPGQPPHEHVFNISQILKEPTCGKAGKVRATCSCGAEQVTEILAPIAHSYTKKVIKEPTCTEAGQTALICSVCNDSQEELVPPIGHHTYLNGECMFCGTSTVTLYSFPQEWAFRSCRLCGRPVRLAAAPASRRNT